MTTYPDFYAPPDPEQVMFNRREQLRKSTNDDASTVYDSTRNFPEVGHGHSDIISVVSDLTTPTVMTNAPVDGEERSVMRDLMASQRPGKYGEHGMLGRRASDGSHDSGSQEESIERFHSGHNVNGGARRSTNRKQRSLANREQDLYENWADSPHDSEEKFQPIMEEDPDEMGVMELIKEAQKLLSKRAKPSPSSSGAAPPPPRLQTPSSTPRAASAAKSSEKKQSLRGMTPDLTDGENVDFYKRMLMEAKGRRGGGSGRDIQVKTTHHQRSTPRAATAGSSAKPSSSRQWNLTTTSSSRPQPPAAPLPEKRGRNSVTPITPLSKERTKSQEETRRRSSDALKKQTRQTTTHPLEPPPQPTPVQPRGEALTFFSSLDLEDEIGAPSSGGGGAVGRTSPKSSQAKKAGGGRNRSLFGGRGGKYENMVDDGIDGDRGQASSTPSSSNRRSWWEFGLANQQQGKYLS